MSRFFDEAKNINELNEMRQELLTQVSAQYTEAVERIQKATPKFKRIRVLPISNVVKAETPIWGISVSTQSDVRSPVLSISSKGINY